MLSHGIKRLKSCLFCERGMSSLELAIGALILSSILMGIVDLSLTNVSHNSISSMANYAAEVIAEQGGISRDKPAHYRGQDYTTPTELLTTLTTGLSSAGLSEDQWTLYVDGREFTTASSLKYDYQDPIDVKLEYEQGFDLLSNVIPGGPITYKRTAHRRVLSAFFHRQQGGNITIH